MSLLGGGVHLTNVISNVATRYLYLGWACGALGWSRCQGKGSSDQDQPAKSSTKLGHKVLMKMYNWPRVSLPAVVPHLAKRHLLGVGVCLTKGQPDLKQFQTWSLNVTTGVCGYN